MSELNTQIELIVSEIISATRKGKTLEDLGKANRNGINDITKLAKNLASSGVSQRRELLIAYVKWTNRVDYRPGTRIDDDVDNYLNNL